MKRHNVLAIAALLVAGASVLLYRSATREETATATSAPSTGVRARPGATAPGRTDEAAAAIQADGRIELVQTEADLLHYFDQLEAEARARGHLEHELAKADAAGRRLLATVPRDQLAPKMIDFGDRMRHLAVDLQNQPILGELDGIRAKLAVERDFGKRRALLEDYARTSAQLDVPTAKLAAAERLRQTLAGEN